MTLTVGSLFSGIGGGDLGLLQAGMALRWGAEIDPFSRRVYAARFPDSTLYGDVRELEGDALEPVDVLIFGSPCQDLSVAGRRAGLAGGRSGLFFEAVRILERLRPSWFIFENVPGLLSSNGGRDYLAVLDALAGLGYGVAGRILDSQFFGVPQRRRRIYLVGCLGDPRRAGQVLFEPEGGSRHPAAGGTPGADVARALTSNTGGSSGKEQQHTFIPTVAGTLGGTGGDGPRADLDRSGAFVAQAFNARNGTAGAVAGTLQNYKSVNAGPLVARALTAPSSPRYDGDTEAFVVPTLRTNNRNNSNGGTEAQMLVAATLTGANGASANAGGRRHEDDFNLVVHALTAEGHDASEDGTGRGTPIVCAPIEPLEYNGVGGGTNADAEEARAREVLRALREAAGEKAFEEWATGVVVALQQAEVLRPQVHGVSLRSTPRDQRPSLDDGAPSRTEARCPGSMLEVWRSECVRRASQEWGLAGQLSGELGAYLQELSQPGAPQARGLRGMWQAAEGLGILRQALSEVQEVWRST